MAGYRVFIDAGRIHAGVNHIDEVVQYPVINHHCDFTLFSGVPDFRCLRKHDDVNDRAYCSGYWHRDTATRADERGLTYFSVASLRKSNGNSRCFYYSGARVRTNNIRINYYRAELAGDIFYMCFNVYRSITTGHCCSRKCWGYYSSAH